MKLQPRRRWVAGGILLGLAGLVGWWCWRQANPPTFRLSDGRIVTVRAVTYGTNHVFVDGPLWLRMVGRYVSRVTAARRGLLRHSFASAEPCTLVWTEWRSSPYNRPPTFATVVDRHGIHSEPKQRAIGASGTTREIQAWQLQNYPRGERDIRLRVLGLGFFAGPDPPWLGDLMIPNPSRRAALWHAPATPVSVTNQEAVVTLLSLRSGYDPPAALTNSFPPLTQTVSVLASATIAAFQVTERGRTNPAWSIRGLEARGSSGNWFRSSLFTADEDRLLAAFGDVLWPDEPDWRLRGEFSRTAGYAAGDLVTLTSVSGLRTNPPFTTNLQVEANGVLLKSLELRGTRQVRRWVRGAYHPNSDLALEFTAPAGMRVDLVRIADDRGREVRFGHLTQPTPTRLEAGVELPYDIRTVDLTFAVHRSLFAEFLVRPDWNTSRWFSASSAFSKSGETVTKGGE